MGVNHEKERLITLGEAEKMLEIEIENIKKYYQGKEIAWDDAFQVFFGTVNKDIKPFINRALEKPSKHNVISYEVI